MGKNNSSRDIEVTPMIQIQDIDIQSSPTPSGMKKIFASYNIFVLSTAQLGFGNTCAVYNPEAYQGSEIEKFIADLQKSIAMAVEDKTKEKVRIQVLFFR